MEADAVKKHDPLPGDATPPEAPGAELQPLFDRARADAFSGSETDELWSRVGAALAAPAASAASHGASGVGATSAAGAGIAVKIAAALLVGGGVVAAGAAYRGMAPRPSPVITVHTAPVEVAPLPEGSPMGSPTASPAAPVDRAAPAVAIDDLPRASDPAPSGPRTRATPDRRDLVRSAASHAAETAESSAGGQAGQDTASVSGAPTTARTSVVTSGHPSDGPGDDHVATTPAATPDPGPTEGALLLHARQELASDPSGALGLTQEHARRFPSGALVQEREVLAIEALARLGRSSDARRRLDAFRTRFPQSPHIERLTTLIGQ
jgi:hypothetical protein